ncbi:hypothetical protein [Homoserinimonas hongtaonis]|uniref:Uncharacterized protein n=1 Tax=Homoserinimonas hongtaonis TaxID=2079791 RepID=A0A2U1SZA8_9MICO|nr:hypothetical protein [Salinibacterium hongtaonis]PWB96942.1 hypothetical protein DF220_03155 [Salinibacterium hongtaonis]
MEFASYMAGERWSDHPECTHPLLAFLARGVNDFTTDRGRQELARLVPSVVGLNGDSPAVDIAIALRVAVTALGSVSESRQRTLATGVIACQRALDASQTDIVWAQSLIAQAEREAPLAMQWAREFCQRNQPRAPISFARAGRAIVSTAVLGAAQACIADQDALLKEMLESAIADCEALLGKPERHSAMPTPAKIWNEKRVSAEL